MQVALTVDWMRQCWGMMDSGFVGWTSIGVAGGCTFPTDEIIAAQNFNSALKFFQKMRVLGPKFHILYENFCDKIKIFRLFSDRAKFMAALPPCTTVTTNNGPLEVKLHCRYCKWFLSHNSWRAENILWKWSAMTQRHRKCVVKTAYLTCLVSKSANWHWS